MKPKLLLWIIGIMLIMPMAFAVTSADLDVNLTAYWDLDRDEKFPLDQIQSDGRNNWSVNTGTAFIADCGSGHGCMNITGVGGQRGIYDASLTGWSRKSWTIMCTLAFNDYVDANEQYLITGDEVANLDLSVAYQHPSTCASKLALSASSDGATNDIASWSCGATADVMVNSIDYMLTVRFNSTHYSVWVDDTEEITVASAVQMMPLTGFHFGDSTTGNSDTYKAEATYDECFFSNRSWTNQEIIYRYNSGTILNARNGAFESPPDTTPPTFSTPATNNSAPKINHNINFSVKATDATAISTVVLAHNMSGTWANISNTTQSGLNYNYSATVTVNKARATVIGYQFFANDTGNYWGASTIQTVTVADTIGYLTIGKNMTTIRVNDVINISSNVTELDKDIDYVMVLNNQTGFSVNTTFVGAYNFSLPITITAYRATVINFTTWYNDTGNNIHTNSTILTVADTAGSIAIGLNATTIYVNSVVNVSGNITEPDGDIDFGMVLNNQTGLSVNTTYDLSGFNANFSKALTITAVRATVINFTVRYNDTANNIHQTSTSLTVANTALTQANIVNTSGLIYNTNQTFNITSSTDADSDAITYSWFYNLTDGSYVFAQAGTTLTSWVTNLTDGTYGILVNASDAETNVSSNYFNFTIDSTPAIVNTTFNKSQTNIKINDVINYTANITDLNGLSFCQIIINQTGINSIINISLEGQITAQCSNKSDINIPRGNVINFTIRVNDTAGNWRTNDTIITIANTNPTQANIVNASNGIFNTNQTFNITPSTDADSDTLTYHWFYNYSNGDYVFIQASKTATSWTTNLTDGDYGLLVNVSDGATNVSSAYFNFTIDSTAMILSTNTLSSLNGAVIAGNKTINIEATANHGWNATLNISQGTNTHLFLVNSTPNGNLIGFNVALNLTGLADGKYNATFEAVEYHSEPPTKLSKGKKGETELIFTDATIGQDISIGVFFREKDNKLTDTPATLKYESSTNAEGFITWQVNITIIKPETKIAFNISTTLGNIEILDTEYKANLRIGDSYGSDAEGTLLVNGIDKSYTATVARNSESEVEVLIIPDTPLAGNDVVVFTSETLFGINQISYTSEFEVDNILPVINYFNISEFVNNSITTQTNFNITVNATDINANITQIYLNSIANATGSYESNVDTNISFTIATDGNYTITIKVNDTAGNEINSTYFYNLVIDTSAPIINYFNISGYPSNGSNSTSNSFNITINITETHPDTAIVYVNDTLNSTGTYANNNSFNISIFNLAEGYYKITVGANDTLGNEINATYYYNLRVDNTAPVISLISPANGSSTMATSMNFTFNVSDGLNFNCTNQIANLDIFNNTNLVSGQFSNRTNLANGNYIWNTTCVDYIGNQRSAFHTLTILPTPPPSAGDTGGSAGGFTAGAEAGAVAFAAQTGFSTKSECEEQGYIYFENTCYHCSNGILVEDDVGDILCKTCKENFIMNEDGVCKYTFGLQSIIPNLRSNFVDKFFNKMFPDNPLLGVAVVVILMVFAFYGYQNRVSIKQRYFR